MEKIFPKVTKCTFNKYGVSGTLENNDGKSSVMGCGWGFTFKSNFSHLHSPLECDQREDLHLPLVLVSHSQWVDCNTLLLLQTCHYRGYHVHGTKKNIINFYYSDPRVFLSLELVPSPATYKTFK